MANRLRKGAILECSDGSIYIYCGPEIGLKTIIETAEHYRIEGHHPTTHFMIVGYEKENPFHRTSKIIGYVEDV